jgi:hypothetical protein
MFVTATVAVAGGAQLRGPSIARLEGRVTFTATGLVPGTYSMRLVYALTRDGAVAGTDCLAEVGSVTTARSRMVTISGVLPRRLACRSAAGPIEGYYTTKPRGGYLITVSRNEQGMPYGTTPFLKRTLRLTS